MNEPRRWWARFPRIGILSLVLVFAEYVCLSLSFDVATLRNHDRLWSKLGDAGDEAPLLFILFAAIVALRGRLGLENAARGLVHQTQSKRALYAEFALGCVAFAVFYWLSRSVLTPLPPSSALFAAWFVAGLVWIYGRTHWAWPKFTFRSVLASAPTWLPVAGVALFSALGGLATRALWSRHSGVVLNAVIGTLRVVGQSPERGPGNEVWLDDFGVDIAPVCSGYEGVGLMIGFLGGYIALMRRELVLWRACLVLPAAVAGVWSANIARIATLTWLGARVSPSLAAGAFHSKAGWLLFCGAGLVGVAVVNRVAAIRTGSKPQEAPLSGHAQETARFLLPIVVASGVSLLTGLVFEPLDRLYPLGVIATLLVLSLQRFDFKDLIAGIQLRSVACGLFACGVWLWLQPLADPERLAVFSGQLASLTQPERGIWFVFRALGSVLTIPIAEELAFRGYIPRRLVARRFEAVAYEHTPIWTILLSALLFALLHDATSAALVVGLLYGLLARWTGGLREAVIAHATTNAALLVHGVLTHDWTSWL
ncbi:MAG TPA: exosortase E/protease, VPEID-CTERM system [Polyangiaceae bacterium]|jgi:exosortase E/protease (VPEID-CTERM system)|nr:exosortase E/protease, VPEID-CTERM system [Polyangiaceae bacterium]